MNILKANGSILKANGKILVASAVIGGRKYRTVKIGNQIWLAENLDYKFPGITINPDWNTTFNAAWYYDKDEATYGIDGTRKCGLLYTGNAAKILNDNRQVLCPGWHVPTEAEFTELLNAVGGIAVAGTKLKAKDNSIGGNWPPNWRGTDDFGFGALPAGYYYGRFGDIGYRTGFWTMQSSSVQSTRKCAYFQSNLSSVSMNNDNANGGHSLRLIKDFP